MKYTKFLIGFFQLFYFASTASPFVEIEGTIENIPMHKVYLTNRGFASGASFILKIYDSCTADENGYFYFKINNIDESKYYSIEFSTIKIGWISLLPRNNEHIKIKGRITNRREIQNISGSAEYVLQKQFDSIANPYVIRLNNYADSSSFYYEKNSDSSKYYTKLNKLYYDTLLFSTMKFAANHSKSTFSLQLINQNIFDVKKDTLKKILVNVDESLKNLSLYKNLLEFANTDEVVTLNNYPPKLDIIDSAERQKQLDVSSYHDKIIIIDFWASWCMPCRENIPSLKLLYDSLDLNKYVFISISIDADKQSWNKALTKENMPWANYLMNPKMKFEMFAKYSLESIPKYVVINSAGKVILITSSFESVQNKIDTIIGSKLL